MAVYLSHTLSGVDRVYFAMALTADAPHAVGCSPPSLPRLRGSLASRLWQDLESAYRHRAERFRAARARKLERTIVRPSAGCFKRRASPVGPKLATGDAGLSSSSAVGGHSTVSGVVPSSSSTVHECEWTADEDERLASLVESMGSAKEWYLIAAHFHFFFCKPMTLTASGCKSRWETLRWKAKNMKKKMARPRASGFQSSDEGRVMLAVRRAMDVQYRLTGARMYESRYE